MIEIEDIRRQSSKVYVPGSSLRNYKKNKANRVTPGNASDKKVVETESDSIISESELDDMMLGDQEPYKGPGEYQIAQNSTANLVDYLDNSISSPSKY